MYGQIKLNTGLARKFPMPESNKERAIALVLFGIAIIFASLFDPMRDLLLQINGQSAQAQLIKTTQYRQSGPKRNIGIYYFQDNYGGKFTVITKKIYETPKAIPKLTKVAWPLGNPSKARILGEYSNRFIPASIGIILLLGGLFINYKEKRQKI